MKLYLNMRDNNQGTCRCKTGTGVVCGRGSEGMDCSPNDRCWGVKRKAALNLFMQAQPSPVEDSKSGRNECRFLCRAPPLPSTSNGAKEMMLALRYKFSSVPKFSSVQSSLLGTISLFRSRYTDIPQRGSKVSLYINFCLIIVHLAVLLFFFCHVFCPKYCVLCGNTSLRRGGDSTCMKKVAE